MANALQVVIDDASRLARDPAMKGQQFAEIEHNVWVWRDAARAARIALAALRKIRRVYGADDEAGEIARDALRRMEAEEA